MSFGRCAVFVVKHARIVGHSLKQKKYDTFSAPVANHYLSAPHLPNKRTTRCFCSTTSGLQKDGDVIEHNPSGEAFLDVPGVKTEGEKMIIMFTCTVCNTRSARKISKAAYTQGIVMVRCGGCKNRHLIADRMGVFEDSIDDGSGGLAPGTGWDIQKYLAKEMGENSKYITDENVYELTAEDIMGAKAASELEKK